MSSVSTHRRAAWFARILLGLAALCLLSPRTYAQQDWVQPGQLLDPSRAILHPQTVRSFHIPLPEQYIWTAEDAAVLGPAKDLSLLKRNNWKVEPHDFRGDVRRVLGLGSAACPLLLSLEEQAGWYCANPSGRPHIGSDHVHRCDLQNRTCVVGEVGAGGKRIKKIWMNGSLLSRRVHSFCKLGG